jgi:hypothetical protein
MVGALRRSEPGEVRSPALGDERQLVAAFGVQIGVPGGPVVQPAPVERSSDATELVHEVVLVWFLRR